MTDDDVCELQMHGLTTDLHRSETSLIMLGCSEL